MEYKFSQIPTSEERDDSDADEKEFEMPKEFEEVLDDVGSYGRYQKVLSFVVLVPISFFVAMSVNLIIFQTLVPDYWCDPPGRETTNFTEQEWWNLTVPRSESGKLEKCLQYEITTLQGVYSSTNTNNTVECRARWTHDNLVFHETMATAKEWLCDREIYSTHILSISIAGNALGTLLLPVIADKYTGRRMMFFIANGIHLVFNLLALVVPSYYMFLTVRFFAGLGFQTNYQMPFVISLELTSPDKRAFLSFVAFIAWTLGMCSTALISWLIPHWWYLVLITCISSALFFGYWLLLPNSPRWLFSKGRVEECKRVLLKVARMNGKKLDEASLEKKLKALTMKEEKVSVQDVLAFKRIVLNFILVTLLSFTVFMAYGCTWMNVKILPDNYFLSYFVLSASEFPSNVIGYLSINYLGRRFTAIANSLLSLIFCFTAIFLTQDRIQLLIAVAMIKIFATNGIFMVTVITSEVIPTPVRSTGLGIVIVSGTLGIMFSPYIVTASGDGPLQYWVMMGLAAASFFLALPLPETLGLALPQTFPEANDIGRNRPLTKFVHHWNRESYP